MVKTVGIICEYNPFHKGHKLQIEHIKRIYDDATIVAIMSGNTTQRGEFAIVDKYTRAKIAIECGVNAVVEMPFPYSSSTAEAFARAGVELAYKMGCDAICFGTELFEYDELYKIAAVINSQDFQNELKRNMNDKTVSYLTIKGKVLEKFGCTLPKSANDMLGVEYIRAIIDKQYPLEVMTLKRSGAHYNDESVCEIMSASAIRKSFYENGEFLSVPKEAMPIYEEISERGNYLDSALSKKIAKCFSLLNCETVKDAFDSNAEIASIIRNASKNSSDENEFENMLSSKLYTKARIKRALLYSIFGIKEIDVPEFTILLGADSKGLSIIKKASKNFPVLTKHSDSKVLEAKEAEALETVYSVDQMFYSLLKNPITPSDAFKQKPYIRK